MSDKTVSDKTVSDKTVSDKTVSDKTVSDKNTAGQNPTTFLQCVDKEAEKRFTEWTMKATGQFPTIGSSNTNCGISNQPVVAKKMLQPCLLLGLVLLASVLGCGDASTPSNASTFEPVSATSLTLVKSTTPGTEEPYSVPPVRENDPQPTTASSDKPRTWPRNPAYNQAVKSLINGSSAESEHNRASDLRATEDEFEPLYVDWPKPELLFFISGRQHGYIEPCGCAGLDQMKGGLLRRQAAINELEAKGWPVLKLDLGDQIQRLGPQAQIKLESTYKALRGIMKYDAIGMGPGELRADSFQVLGTLLNTSSNDEVSTPFVSANASIFDDSDAIKPYIVLEKNGRKVGVTSVVASKFFNGLGDMTADDRDTKVFAPEVGIAKILPQLMAEKCDVHVLLAFVPEEDSIELAKKFPQFHFIVNEGVEGEPMGKLDYVRVGERSVAVMQMGYKSMFAGAIAIYADQDNPVRFQKIPLDHRFKDTEEMKAVFKNYQMELQKKGLLGLVGQPVTHPSGYSYIGSEACSDCHEAEYEIWKEGTSQWKEKHPGEPGPHSRATADLVLPGERTWVARNHDPECLSCHVTGWNAQKYFAYKSGYWEHDKDSILYGSGCENCHGPGSRHAEIENGADADDLEKENILKQLRIKKEVAKENLCSTCHDLNNSPDFEFESYWPMIAH